MHRISASFYFVLSVSFIILYEYGSGFNYSLPCPHWSHKDLIFQAIADGITTRIKL